MKYRLILLCVIFASICACKRKVAVNEIIAQMKSCPVELCIEQMKPFNENAKVQRNVDSISCTFVIYIDSVHCVPCKLARLKYWKEFEIEIHSKYPYLGFIAAFEQPSKSHVLLQDYVNEEFSIPVFVDDKHLFHASNPHIPNNEIFHSFLLDSDNNIVLVGNPITNERIEDLLYQLLDSIGEKKRTPLFGVSHHWQFNATSSGMTATSWQETTWLTLQIHDTGESFPKSM